MSEVPPFTPWRSAPARRPAGCLAALALVLALAACGGGDGGPAADGASGSAAATASAGGGDGELHEVRGPIDEAMAARGERLFRDLGCMACHRLDVRLVGPPLGDVASRRSYPWFHHMVTNPDSMIRNDSIGRALLSEYLTPMANQGVTAEEARALFEYFRQVGGSGAAARTDGSEGRATDSGDGEGS